jgi:hypothetical protein
VAGVAARVRATRSRYWIPSLDGCTQGGGRLELLEIGTDEREIRGVLERLDLDDEPPESGDDAGEPRIRGP